MIAKFLSPENNLYNKHKHKLIFFGAFFIILFLVEVFGFNRGLLFYKILKLEERHYSVTDGALFQFNLENGRLIAQTNNPNVIFENINLPVDNISINCTNSTPGDLGIVYYRNSEEPFSEAHSVRYDASLPNNTVSLIHISGVPTGVTVFSLRFDLTHTLHDTISCSDIVVNPHIPFNLNPARLAIYVGLLLLAILFIYWNTKPIRYLRQKTPFSIIIFLVLSIVLSAKLMPFAISKNFIPIAIFCIFLFSAAATYALKYLATGSDPGNSEKASVVKKYKYEIALTIIIVITMLPLLTESFFYYDDWWGLGNLAADIASLNVQSMVTFARPFHNFTFLIFNNISIHNAFILKWVALPAVILYAVVLYRWLSSKTQNNGLSFLLACILSVFAPVMDCLGYGSITPYFYSVMFSAFSVICFEHAYECYLQKEKSKLLINFAFAFIMLFVALLTYQVGVQIVFILLAVAVYFNFQKKSLFKFNFAYLIFFGVTNVSYLLIFKILRWIYHAGTWRSQTIGSQSELVGKIYFFKAVLIQCIMQIEAAFTGGSFFNERYRGYFISFSNQNVGNLLFMFVIVMIVLALISYWLRTRSVLGLLSLLAFIPMSFFVFLILSESGYLTYYAFGLISLLMFYFLTGLISFAQLVWEIIRKLSLNFKTIVEKEFKPAYLLLPMLVLSALVSNYYVRDFYVNYNSAVYNFVKYSIQTAIETGDIKRIHVYGLISPINADVYSGFVVDTALKDLGKNVPDYEITYSRNKYFFMRMQEADYVRIYDLVPEHDKQILDRIYAFGETYSEYYIKAWPSEEDQLELQRIFMSAGVIPQASSSDTLVIDITWTDQAYYNHIK